MSDKEWDAEDYEPKPAAAAEVKVTDKWDGEDEDDDLKDNWDDEEQEGGDADKAGGEVAPRRKKKSIKDIIAEKEAKKKLEIEERRKLEEERRKKLSPEELLADKLRQQKRAEDADLSLAKEMFGAESNGPEGKIDAFDPITKEDFDSFSNMLCEKISLSERSTFYVGFLENLFRELAVKLEADEVKRLSSTLNLLHNEKTKALKGKAKKKGKGKASLNAGKDGGTANYEDYQPNTMDDYDDFI